MEASEFEQRMREAVLLIMNHLPDKRKNPQDVLGLAGQLLGQNGRSQEGLVILAELINKMPRFYGVERQRGFWTIARKFVTSDYDLLQAYLSWVPASITGAQRAELRRYLLGQGFDQVKVDRALEQFGHRDNITHARGAW